MNQKITFIILLISLLTITSCNTPSPEAGQQSEQVGFEVEPVVKEPTGSAETIAETAPKELPAVVVVSDSSTAADSNNEVEPTVEPEPATEETLTQQFDKFESGTKIGRFLYQAQVWHGVVLEDGMVQRIEGDLFTQITLTDEVIPLEQLEVLAPILPSKIIAIGLNYRSHAGESGAGAPGLFSKFPSSLAGPNDPIWLFPESDNTHYEGELVVVIGKTAHNVSEAEASEYIFGVTAGNDITERTWQQTDLQWIRAKASDSFAPIGPFIVTGLNYNDLLVQTRVNGVTTQSESTASLIHSVDKIVSYTSRYITLEPGDIIYTGTPGSTGAMSAGDVIEVEVEGVGILRNTAQPWTPDS